MERSKTSLLSIVIIVFLINACRAKDEIAEIYKKTTNSFFNDSSHKHLINQFPRNISKKEFVHMLSIPPPCSVKHKSFKGEFYLIKRINEPNNRLDSIIKTSIAKYNYNDNNNFKIDLMQFEEQEQNKCNRYFSNKYPIPYFETYNFELGEVKSNKAINYVIPNDLKVYVLDSRNIPICNVKNIGKRPALLKGWKRGYSKGIAISDKEKIAVYWTFIW